METKICSKCGKELPLSDFYLNGKTRRSSCKFCHNERVKQDYKARKDNISQIKEFFGCAKCGDKREYVLDFHHKDPSQKDFTIARNAGSNSIQRVKEELLKCVILCSNCHREFHYLNEITQLSIETYLKEGYKTYSEDDLTIFIKSLSTHIAPIIKEPKKEIPYTREELKSKIRQQSFSEIGRENGVSDNAIRRWCEKHNLPRTKKEINSYSIEEWEKL